MSDYQAVDKQQAHRHNYTLDSREQAVLQQLATRQTIPDGLHCCTGAEADR